jgi:hypothetical protein
MVTVVMTVVTHHGVRRSHGADEHNQGKGGKNNIAKLHRRSPGS